MGLYLSIDPINSNASSEAAGITYLKDYPVRLGNLILYFEHNLSPMKYYELSYLQANPIP
jgi:hypothetical protein